MEASKLKPDLENIAFIVMPFNKSDVDKVYTTVYSTLCEEFGLFPFRTDKHSFGDSLNKEIFDLINQAKLIIADLSYERPNCYAEVGYALGRLRHTSLILLARKDHDPRRLHQKEGDHKVHFDLDSHKIIYWELDKLDKLSIALREAIEYKLSLSSGLDKDKRSIHPVQNPIDIHDQEISDLISDFLPNSKQTTHISIVATPLSQVGIPKERILEIASQANARRIGHPIGSVRNRKDNRPHFYKDGIKAIIAEENVAQVWSLKYDGRFVSVLDFYDLSFRNGFIDPVYRIFVICDLVHYLGRLTRLVENMRDISIVLSVKYTGMRGKRLTDRDSELWLGEEYECYEGTFFTGPKDDFAISTSEILHSPVDVIESLSNEFFHMFDGLQIP